jgi:hypothetical protein
MYPIRVGPPRLAMLAGLLLGGFVVSCANTRGPELVVNSHGDYNRAIGKVMNEELLLNLVRRRFLEFPRVTSISSISTNFSTSVSAGADATMGDDPTYGVNGDVTFTDSPTVTITPLDGSDVAQNIHSPMSVDNLGYLANAGYRVELLLALLVQDLNGVRGIQGGVGEDFQPGTTEFTEMLGLVRTLQERDELVVGTFRWEDTYVDFSYPRDQITPEVLQVAISLESRWDSWDGGKTLYMTDHGFYPCMAIKPEAIESPEGRRLIELLTVDPAPDRRVWPFNPAKVVWGSDLAAEPDHKRYDLKARMRSFFGLMNLLAHGIEVPEEQAADAFSMDRYAESVRAGLVYDVTEHFVVKSSVERPESAFVAVEFGGFWYYIESDDRRSKHVFNAVLEVYQLEVAPATTSTTPVLTLPVN